METGTGLAQDGNRQWTGRVRGGAAMFAVAVAVTVILNAGPACAADAPNDPRAVAELLEQAFTTVAEQAFPAVAVITNKQTERRRPMYHHVPPEWRFFFGNPGGQEQQGQPDRSRKVPQPVGKGSGIVIRADGYILTNYHVIRGHDALEVQLNGGQVFDSARDPKAVEVIGTDEATDLAVIRVGNGEAKNLPTLAFADSDRIKVGQWAIAVGAPFSLDYSVTVGHVSQKGRHAMGVTTFENYIQTDADINPGNSGGPLLNIRGEVIGVNEFIASSGPSLGSIGLGFAIASNLAKQVADDLIEHGEVLRPFLGIGMQELTDDLKREFGVEAGVLVSEVTQDDPAEKAGIKAGDVVLKIGDKLVRTPHDLLFAVLAYEPGDKVRVLVSRRGKDKEFVVVARRRDSEETTGTREIEDAADLLQELGLVLEEGDDAVTVSGVVAGSAAAAADVRRGDVILEVNQQKVKTPADVIEALSDTSNNFAVFYVKRRKAKFFVPVPLQKQD